MQLLQQVRRERTLPNGIPLLNDAEKRRDATVFTRISESDGIVSLFISNFNASFCKSCTGDYYK